MLDLTTISKILDKLRTIFKCNLKKMFSTFTYLTVNLNFKLILSNACAYKQNSWEEFSKHIHHLQGFSITYVVIFLILYVGVITFLRKGSYF